MIEDNVVIHEVEYPVGAQRVWQALVDPAELAQWLMPNNFVPTVGGRFTMECDPVGEIEGEVLEMDPPRRLVCKWTGSFGETIVSFALNPTPAGTKLRVEHRGWVEANADARDRFDSGWPGKADALRRLIEINLGVQASSASAGTDR